MSHRIDEPGITNQQILSRNNAAIDRLTISIHHANERKRKWEDVNFLVKLFRKIFGDVYFDEQGRIDEMQTQLEMMRKRSLLIKEYIKKGDQFQLNDIDSSSVRSYMKNGEMIEFTNVNRGDLYISKDDEHFVVEHIIPGISMTLRSTNEKESKYIRVTINNLKEFNDYYTRNDLL